MMQYFPFRSGYALFSGLLLTGLTAFARPGQPIAKPPVAAPLSNDLAVQRTRQMAQQLGLSEHQFIRLLPLNRLYLAQRLLISQQPGTNLGTRTARLAQLEADYEQAYRDLLTTQQLGLLPASPVAAARFDLGITVAVQP